MEKIRIRCQGASVADYKTLLPFQGDLKDLSDEDYARMKAVILKNGFTAPMHVWQDADKLYTLDGHQRCRVIERMKADGHELPDGDLFPIDYVHADSYGQAKEILLSHASVYGTVNQKGLADFLNESKLQPILLKSDFKLPELNFKDFTKKFFPTTVSFNTGDKNPDEVPVIPQETVKSKAGDIWILGSHRLMCGDSKNPDDIAKLMGGEGADMVFTDPPYGIDIHERANYQDGKQHGSALAPHNEYKPVIGDEDLQAVTAVLPWCLKQRLCVLWGANNYPGLLPPSNGWLVWNKEQHADFGDCELAYTNVDKAIRMFTHKWVGFMKASERGEARVHPTQKPVALAEWCFDLFQAGMNVVDLFGGSGSTLIACEKTGRKCFMMEISPAYVDIVVARYEKFTGKSAILQAS